MRGFPSCQGGDRMFLKLVLKTFRGGCAAASNAVHAVRRNDF